MTQGEYVSRVMNTLKVLNKDEHLSRRYVLATIKSIAKREIIDNFCVNLCGYSLGTLLRQYEDQFKDDGTEGQDRESYTDDQDRESYTVTN